MIDTLSLLLAPLAAGILVLSTHVVLGEQVLRRGIVFIDLAIAQVAALGVMIAATLVEDETVAGIAGAVAALAGAALVSGLARRFPAIREALIGLVYVGGAVLALLWISVHPHEARHQLATMLSGDVLWVTWAGLLPLAAVSVPFLLLHLAGHRSLTIERGFYPWFALLVSMSVPLLGLYLVFATLIVPALVRTACPASGWMAVVGLGTLAYAIGLLGSLGWDLPSGPCVVIALIVLGAAALLVRRPSGTGP
ncbi:MAG: metal ABC transporter permease [Lautropia sp.]